MQIATLRKALGSVPEDTKGNVEKKQARTYEELQAEAAEAEAVEIASDSENEDDFVYNPLKLPLGYDGKPIPYWLYKLHGLNQVSILPTETQTPFEHIDSAAGNREGMQHASCEQSGAVRG